MFSTSRYGGKLNQIKIKVEKHVLFLNVSIENDIMVWETNQVYQ